MKRLLLVATLILSNLFLANVFAEEVKEINQSMPLCEVVSTLLREHKTGFKSLRGARTETKYMIIWKAKYDVVGSGCEIWQSGKDVHYVCTRSSPTKSLADDYYKMARERAHACLGNDWKESEVPRKAGGIKTVFLKQGFNVSIELHEVKVDGLLKDQWTIYYIVGDSEKGI